MALPPAPWVLPTLLSFSYPHRTLTVRVLPRTINRKENMKNPPFEAQAFAKWLNGKGACRESLKWQHGKTLRETWDTCERGDWLEWLLNACGYQWTAPAWAEYGRVTAPALAEYGRVKAQAWAEYERVTAPAWAEYERVAAPALAEYGRVTAPALAEYGRVTAPALAEYERVTADTIRMLIPYPFK